MFPYTSCTSMDLCIRFGLCGIFYFSLSLARRVRTAAIPSIQASICTRQGQAALDTRRRRIVLYFFCGKRMGKRGDSHDGRKRTSHVCAMRNRKGAKKAGYGEEEVSAFLSSPPPSPSWLASKQDIFSFSTLVCCTSIGASRSGGRESRAGEQADKPAWPCANKYYLTLNYIFHPRVLPFLT